ncbi:MFS transporter [Belnapia sp. T6]|uniref:MFS transporter n=1 Tax=Belnapia mucosa TaxID=2804532 RepID=A0ABS1V5A4_9PROT|nr:MFS transporter [Belnapia mucosa]MBL6456849.1 MFS transporter [Belnapia mucosa]
MAGTGGLGTALAATTAAQSMATLAVFTLPVLAPMAARDLGAEPHWLGWQVACTYAAASAASMFSGGVLRRLGPARCTQLALANGALACLLIVTAGLAGAVLGSFLTGIGYGLTNPSASQVLARLTPPERRNRVFAVKQTGVPIGGALAGALLPGLATGIGWRAAVLAVGLVLALAAACIGVFRRHWDAEREPDFPIAAGAGGGLIALRTRPGLGALAAISGLFSGFQLALGAYIVTMLVEEGGWAPVAAGFVSSVSQAVGIGARIAWGVVADWWRSGMKTLAAIGVCTCLGGALLPAALAGPAALLVVLLCLLGTCAAGWNGLLLAEAARLAAPGKAGDAAGGVLAVAFFGVVVGPSLFGLAVALTHSYALAFGLLSIFPGIGALIAWRSAVRARPPAPRR